MRKLYIRTDASGTIGLGHLIRCTSLAYMLNEYFEIKFFCKEIPEKSKQELSTFHLQVIESELQFFNQLNKDLIIVLDGYHFDTIYQQKIKEAGSKLICIDDLHDQSFVADLIINHAPGIKPSNYIARPDTTFALGLDYALLRPAFLNQAKKKRTVQSISSLFICFGGADIKNLTHTTLKTAIAFNKFNVIYVVTGSAYKYLHFLDSLVSTDSRIQHFHAITENEVLQLMVKSDLAVVPSSGILYEAIAAGCITISGWYVENQRNIYKGFRDLNSIIAVEDFKDLSRIINNLELRDRLPRQDIIDGLSGTRILSAIKNMLV
jgi:UDP-2,4-diacetamido-2,4,6-trideoxy-beta-L-altropyranose hydrolase